jgi:prephenate dehydrogenase
MDPAAHDATFAAVSHLPHFLAFAYMHGLAAQPDVERHLRVAGPGFRDFTRIACSTSAIWRDIFSANRDEVLQQLSHFEAALATFRSALESQSPDRDTELSALVDAASAVRRGWTP